MFRNVTVIETLVIIAIVLIVGAVAYNGWQLGQTSSPPERSALLCEQRGGVPAFDRDGAYVRCDFPAWFHRPVWVW